MMEISTLGTKICDDAIHYSNGKIVNKNRFVEISPFTLADEYSFTASDNVNPLFDIIAPNDYMCELFKSELQCSIISKLSQELSSNSYLVVDMLICRLPFKEFTFDNGSVFRLTWGKTCMDNIDNVRQYIQSVYNSKIISEAIINPMLWNDSKLECELKVFYNLILNKLRINHLILLKVHNCTQYINNLEIGLVPHAEVSIKINTFHDKCVKIFDSYDEFITIELPSYLLCDPVLKGINCFNYNKIYYEYICDCLILINNNKYTSKAALCALNSCNISQKQLIDEAVMTQLCNLTFYRYHNRKIVLIGESSAFEHLLKKKYGLNISKRVDYTADTSYDSLNSELSEISNNYNEYFCVIPYIYSSSELLKLLWLHGYSQQRDYILPIHKPMLLKNFTGVYNDLYNNHIASETPVSVEIKGCGANVNIKKIKKDSNYLFNLVTYNQMNFSLNSSTYNLGSYFTIMIYDCGNVKIGDNAEIGDNVHIRCSFFDETVIGDNVNIGTDSVIFNGDAHAIIDVNTGANTNYDFAESPIEKHRIIIGNNTVIGNDCFIFSGSNISANCVIRDKSFVNKAFGHNSYIAGHPAKFVKNIN